MSEAEPRPLPTQAATTKDLHLWSQALSAIARTGLGYTESPFEIERFEEILAIAADIAAKAGPNDDETPLDRDVLVAQWLAESRDYARSYITPKVAVGAVVADDEGRLLLIKRADSGLWLYPTGWADIGYSPAEVVVKEVREETGIDCRVEHPIAIYDGLRGGFSHRAMYSLVFLCRAVGGELRALPHECLDVGFFARGELPEPTANAQLWADTAFDAIAALNAGETTKVWFDEPRANVWAEPPAESGFEPGPNQNQD